MSNYYGYGNDLDNDFLELDEAIENLGSPYDDFDEYANEGSTMQSISAIFSGKTKKAIKLYREGAEAFQKRDTKEAKTKLTKAKQLFTEMKDEVAKIDEPGMIMKLLQYVIPTFRLIPFGLLYFRQDKKHTDSVGGVGNLITTSHSTTRNEKQIEDVFSVSTDSQSKKKAMEMFNLMISLCNERLKYLSGKKEDVIESFDFDTDDIDSYLYAGEEGDPDLDFDMDDSDYDSSYETDELDADDVELTPSDESMLFMSFIQDNSTPEEFEKIVTESAVEMECYGLIESADSAMEAMRNIVRLNKQANFSREESKAELLLARRANNINYKQYKKFRALMKEFRVKIHDQFGSKAKSEARKIISNSRHKASAMKSKSANSLMNKIDTSLKKVNNKLRTGAAIPNKQQ